MKNEKQVTDLVQVKTQLAKVSPEDMSRLFNNQSSGLAELQETNMNVKPLELKIVQKLTGEAMFESPFDRKDHGKVFAKPEKVKGNDGKWVFQDEDKIKDGDMREVYTATLLKVEFGCEIWKKERKEGADFDDKTVYARSKDMIRPDEREMWLATHNPSEDAYGYKYTNMIKMILTPYSFEEVSEMMLTGKNPFVVLELHGTDGWNTWRTINKRMTEVKRELKVKSKLSDMLSSLFVFDISSQPTEDGKYYMFNVDVRLNDINEALRLEELVNNFSADFTFFYNTSNMNPALRSSTLMSQEEEVNKVFDSEGNEVDENGEVR